MPDPLLEAWERWDRWASRKALTNDRKPADLMEDQCKRYAASLGLTTTQLREALMRGRRAGYGREQALERFTRARLGG